MSYRLINSNAIAMLYPYVNDMPCIYADLPNGLDGGFYDMAGCEEIVRCRDCKHSYKDIRDTSIGWVDVFVCDSKQWSTLSLMPSHKVEPDGFCKWGEPKEGGDD